MSQQNSMARKIKVLVDGTEIPGLVKFGEVPLENSMIQVPLFDRIVNIHNGMTTMPAIPLTYETQRSTSTRSFLRSWFNNKEVHDVTVVQCDATGTEYERIAWTDVECSKLSEPEHDASSPTYAQITVTLLPYDIKEVQ
jgi:hypothetical protein